MDSHPQRGSVMPRHRWMSRCLIASTTVLMVAVGGSAAMAQPIETTPAVPTTTQSTPAPTSPDLVPLDAPADTTAIDPCAIPTTTPPATTTTTPPPTTTTTTPVVPAECVTTSAVPEPVTPTPASETVPEPAAPSVTAVQEPEPAAPAEETLAPVPAEMIPAAPAADQPIAPDDPELSSKTAEPDPDWAPTENPNATLVPGQMRSDREEIPAPFTKEDADKAEMGEARLRSSRSLMASGCQYYWPSPFQVCDDIRDKYNSLGGPASFLSYPTSGNIVNPDGTGQRVTFLNGPIYWHPSAGAHPVVNSFLNRWGIHSYEAGWLGYPTTDEIVHADAVGRRQEFQHGAIYVAFVNAIGSAIPNGPIRDKWNAVGAETPGSLLGYPIQDQVPLPDGQGQMDRFERGVVYWHPSSGAWPVTGTLLDKWKWSGYEQGSWGYPSGDQTGSGSTAAQQFQYGMMTALEDAAAVVDDGEIDPLYIDGPAPTTPSEIAADAHVGVRQGDTLQLISSSPAISEDPCQSGLSCIDADPTEPTIDAPNDPDDVISERCLNETPHDGHWWALRKQGCSVLDTGIRVVDAQTLQEVGFLPYKITMGAQMSHKSGIIAQRYRLEFGQQTGTVGIITLKYELSPGARQVHSVTQPMDSIVYAGSTIEFDVQWDYSDVAAGTYTNTPTQLRIWYGNEQPNLTDSTPIRLRLDVARCDATMRYSNGDYRVGCVFPGYTPGWAMNEDNSIPQATGHVQAAIASGLPGSSSSPLHRQTDIGARNANRSVACPRGNAVAAARRDGVPTRSCDEYPFASSVEGAAANIGAGRTFNPNCHVPDLSSSTGSPGYSACMIEDADNKLAGSQLGAFYGINRVINQDAFYVRPVGGALPPAP
jgi:hypothetical protein